MRPAGSTGRVTLTGCRGLLDRVQHPMARDRVVERGAEMRSLAIVVGEARVRLGDVGGRAGALWRLTTVLLLHQVDLKPSLAGPSSAPPIPEKLGRAPRGGEP